MTVDWFKNDIMYKRGQELRLSSSQDILINNWWKLPWSKHPYRQEPAIERNIETELPHRCTDRVSLSIENCANFAQTMRRDNWRLFLCTFPKVVLTRSWRRWRPGPISEVIKMDDGRFGCSVSHTTNVKAKYGWKWMQTRGKKLQMNGILHNTTLCGVNGVKSISNFGRMRFASHIWICICPRRTYLKSLPSSDAHSILLGVHHLILLCIQYFSLWHLTCILNIFRCKIFYNPQYKIGWFKLLWVFL